MSRAFESLVTKKKKKKPVSLPEYSQHLFIKHLWSGYIKQYQAVWLHFEFFP